MSYKSNRYWRSAACCATVLFVSALASGSAHATCWQESNKLQTVLFSLKSGSVNRLWGQANVTWLNDGSLRVYYPKGSINPGNKTAPIGGAGWLQPVAEPAEALCVSYQVRFAPGFNFGRGGKLPGLFGGSAPSGCTREALTQGFSARLMWRKDGEGEIYLYSLDRKTKCGDSIGRGAFRFIPGKLHTIVEEVVLNNSSRSDGVLRLWFDDHLVVERSGLLLRNNSKVLVNGLMFATFFGGSDASWASPQAQWAEFSNFRLWPSQHSKN